MPVSRNYSGGSIIYFENDRGQEIYVLQKGRVVMTQTALDTGEEIKSDVQMGEFFGVKSSLGGYPREETAQALGNTTVLVFKQPEFEALVMKNTRLIMKMLRVFSKQLRDVHRQVREIMKQGAAREPSFELMNVAETYLKGGQYDFAVYAFQKYMDHYPGGRYEARAQEMLQTARKNQPYPIGYPALEPGPAEDYAADLGIGNSMMPAAAAVDDPFALPPEPTETAAPPPAEKGVSDLLFDGLDLYSKEDYAGALKIYESAMSGKSPKNQEEADAFGRCHFEKARALIKLEKLEDATTTLSAYIKKFPTGEYVKDSIYHMGLAAELQGNTERAKTLYMKTATMPPPDNITAEAKKRLEKLG